MTRRSLRNLAATVTLVGALGVSTAAAVPPVEPSQPHRSRAAQSATLTVLSGSVEASSDGKTYRSLLDGQTLGAELVLRTRSDSSALVTLYDGTEVAVPTNARLNLRQLDSRPHMPELSMPEVAYRVAGRLGEERGVVSLEGGPVPPSVGLIRG